MRSCLWNSTRVRAASPARIPSRLPAPRRHLSKRRFHPPRGNRRQRRERFHPPRGHCRKRVSANAVEGSRFWFRAHRPRTTKAGLTPEEFTTRVSSKTTRGTARLANSCDVVSVAQQRHTVLRTCRVHGRHSPKGANSAARA